MILYGFSRFNPRPLLLTGESHGFGGGAGQLRGFNPRPLLLTGESVPTSAGAVSFSSFNPRPLLLTGESKAQVAVMVGKAVSIHARYC